ncbi:MAG: TasA family protein [Dehalococcoidales bacterium]|jgi:predicted ribosomally synthesized peptide with SipW-like signal peptide
MKKVLVSLVIIALVMALMGTGVYALFSDTETSTGNSFTAGTFNLVDVISGTATSGNITVNEAADGFNDNVVFTLVKPGDAGTITWTLTNAGDIAGTLTIVATTSFSQGVDTEPELALPAAGLDSKIDVVLTRGGTTVYIGPMSGLAAAFSGESNVMAGASSLVYVLSWSIAGTVGNEIQGDTATLNVTFNLNQ